MASQSASEPGGPQRRLPGEEGIWMFVLGDMLMFGLFFTVYLFYRGQDVSLYDRSQQLLDANLGVLNTILLLTSSWFVVLGVRAVRGGMPRTARKLLLAGSACAAGFVLVKIVEYGAKIGEGITLQTNEFFMYYYMYTGIHLVHVLLGLGVLLMLSAKAAAAGPGDIRQFENGATFWHMVDLLWIMLFPLLYLVAG